jgi:hypothetical protein
VAAAQAFRLNRKKIIESTQQVWYNAIKINSHRYKQGGMSQSLQGLRLPWFRQYAASFKGRRFLFVSRLNESDVITLLVFGFISLWLECSFWMAGSQWLSLSSKSF